MLVPGSVNPLLLTSAAGAAAGGISRSIRLNAPDSAYLSRTPASAGNRKTWTWAGWVKRTNPGREERLFGASTNSSNFSMFEFTSTDKLSIYNYVGGVSKTYRLTTQVFRDPSAWFHLVVAADSSSLFKVYVNGAEVTAFDTSTGPDASDWFFNAANLHTLGTTSYSLANYFNGYVADVYMVDGQALTPSSFTETDATTGQLIPKAFSGSYGTNGFRLTFSDNSGTSATTLGKDSAGSNNWTPNNFSVASGSGNDSLVDVPTNGAQTDTGVGGEVRGNYATLNPLDNGGLTISNGNLDYIRPSNGYTAARATIGMSAGKWYWEQTIVGTPNAGIFAGISAGGVLPTYPGQTATSYGYSYDGDKYTNNSASAYGASYTTGDILGIAFDAGAGTLTFYKNGTSQGSAFTGLTSGPFFPTFSSYLANAGSNVNFGQRPFAYTAPSGFKALNTANLPAPAVVKSNTVFDTVLYTGTGSSRSITGLAFSPDLVWIKIRSSAFSHCLTDTVRGATKEINSNLTNAESTDTNGLTAFNSDGFSLGSSTVYNGNASTFVAWTWDAGSSTVTNTQGSITSSVRANATAGFSVVTYTGNGTSGATVGHGLGVKPSLIILKSRSNTYNWAVYHSSVGATKFLQLNTTVAATAATSVWNDTEPTSTLITFGNDVGENGNGATFVAYCFAPVVGYSNGFSYTGNGSTDGSFVYLGFRPRLILLKCSSTTGNWTLVDTAREGYNVDNDPLYPNLSDAEGTTDLLDITSNGFKLRTTDASVNSNAATYIGFAWAESPFNYSRAR